MRALNWHARKNFEKSVNIRWDKTYNLWKGQRFSVIKIKKFDKFRYLLYTK